MKGLGNWSKKLNSILRGFLGILEGLRKGHTHFIEPGISDVVDASHHRRADVVLVATFEIAVEIDSLAESIQRHRLLGMSIVHGEIRLERSKESCRRITRIPDERVE